MRVPITAALSCLLVSSLHADTVLYQDLVLKFFVNGNLQSSVSSAQDSTVTLNDLGSSGWAGTASLIASANSNTNGTLPSSASPQESLNNLQLPYTIDLTNLSVTCLNQNGCKSALFSFEDDLLLSDGSSFYKQPYSVGVTGTGDVDVFPFYQATVNGLDAFRVNAALNAGTYNFQTSGTIGNVSSGNFTFDPRGPFGNVSVGNFTDPQGFVLKGSFAISGAEFNQTVSLPHSFEVTLGAAPVSSSPEPGTWWMAGGCLLSAIIVLAARRRMPGRKTR